MENFNTNHNIPPQCLGVSGASNMKPPTDAEKRLSIQLEETLLDMNIFENEREEHQRNLVLSRLERIANDWVSQRALAHKIRLSVANKPKGKLFVFGSYRLGVKFKGSDLDVLFLVPTFITREEFFLEFKAVLCQEKGVEDVIAIPAAFVPLIKMKLLGVAIDLLFAQAHLMTIPDNFSLVENTEELLGHMDEKDVRSVNGVRITEDLLNLVHQKEIFKKSLTAIRLWAKRKNIYSNACGFLGGVGWAILVCRICQLYPMAYPSIIIYTFFRIYKDWPWHKPVRLRASQHFPTLALPVWDPRRNPSDQFHLMPILTPSYPYQNSAYNVLRSNQIIIQRELSSGYNVVKAIMLGKQPWSDLFTPAPFFTYRHYLCVTVSSDEEQAFREHCGLVGCKLRILARNLECTRFVQLVHVNPQGYGKGPNDGNAVFVRKWFIGIEFGEDSSQHKMATGNANSQASKVNVDLTGVVRSFQILIANGSCGALNPSDSVTVEHLKRSNLAHVLPPEEMAVVRMEKKTSAAKTSSKRAPVSASAHQLPQTTSRACSSGSSNVTSATSMEPVKDQPVGGSRLRRPPLKFPADAPCPKRRRDDSWSSEGTQDT